MLALVNTQTNEILFTSSVELNFDGAWGELQASGVARWKPAPAEHESLLKVVGGNVVVDVDKKAAQQAARAAKDTRRATIKALNASPNSVAALKAALAAMAQELGFEVDP